MFHGYTVSLQPTPQQTTPVCPSWVTGLAYSQLGRRAVCGHCPEAGPTHHSHIGTVLSCGRAMTAVQCGEGIPPSPPTGSDITHLFTPISRRIESVGDLIFLRSQICLSKEGCGGGRGVEEGGEWRREGSREYTWHQITPLLPITINDHIRLAHPGVMMLWISLQVSSELNHW